MALVQKVFPRVTEPDARTLEASLAPLLAVSNAGGFNILAYDEGRRVVVIEYGDWTGVDLVAVQNTVAGVATRTYRTDAKTVVDDIPVFQKAAWLVTLDELNILRSAASLAPRTVNQFLNLIKSKVDTL